MRWQSFIIKDKILRYLSNPIVGNVGSEKLATELKIKHYAIYTLLSEMALRGHVKNIGTATVSSEFYTYNSTILPAGKYFIDNGGYKWEWVKTAIVDFPKTFWWLIALLSFFAGRDLKCE